MPDACALPRMVPLRGCFSQDMAAADSNDIEAQNDVDFESDFFAEAPDDSCCCCALERADIDG